jgi:calcium/calmodulin-dependent protein kinase (CaM kinase) II
MDGPAETELLHLNQKLLAAIVTGDWNTYASLCDESLTCFEPESRGQLVVGLEFHRFYFELPGGGAATCRQVTMSQPHVRWLGSDAAVVSYVRLTQSVDEQGRPQTSRVEETRVWQRRAGQWKHVHFHRSASP